MTKEEMREDMRRRIRKVLNTAYTEAQYPPLPDAVLTQTVETIVVTVLPYYARAVLESVVKGLENCARTEDEKIEALKKLPRSADPDLAFFTCSTATAMTLRAVSSGMQKTILRSWERTGFDMEDFPW